MTEVPTNRSPKAPDAQFDDSALSAIRSILTDETVSAGSEAKNHQQTHEVAGDAVVPRQVRRKARKADALPPLAKAEADPDASLRAAKALSPKSAKRSFPFRRKLVSPKPEMAKAEFNADGRHAEAKANAGLVDRLQGYRPTIAHGALGVFALLVLFRPWLIIGIAFLFGLILVGVLLILGYDGFWQGVMRLSRWYASRRPSRAAVMHERLDRFAVRWDSFLDRFPEGSVDGLYLPDFGGLAAADRRHEDAMERRLNGMQEGGV